MMAKGIHTRRAPDDQRVGGATKAAHYAGVSRHTIYEWARKGYLHPIEYPMRGVKFDFREIDEFINKCKRKDLFQARGPKRGGKGNKKGDQS